MTVEHGLGWLPRLPEPVLGCWYVDRHWDFDRKQRTPAGQLLYEAKTYGEKLGQPQAAQQLAQLMAAQLNSAGSRGPFPMDQVTLVVPVPTFPAKIPYNLPDVLAATVATKLDRPLGAQHISKVRHSEAKRGIVPASAADYRANETVDGEVVLIVDDVVMSGATLSAIARVLRDAGAVRIGGYVATHAVRGMTF